MLSNRPLWAVCFIFVEALYRQYFWLTTYMIDLNWSLFKPNMTPIPFNNGLPC